MTIFPEEPKLVPVEGKEGIKRLAESHLTFIKVGFGYSLEVLVKSGYETDGASIPTHLLDDKDYGSTVEKYIHSKYPNITTRYDFENLIKFLVGTQWDMPRLLAAIVHDALYGRKWHLRWCCDRMYAKIETAARYDKRRVDIEYLGIRLAGWKNWNAVTDLEVARTKELTEVKFIKTKKIQKEIERLKSFGF